MFYKSSFEEFSAPFTLFQVGKIWNSLRTIFERYIPYQPTLSNLDSANFSLSCQLLDCCLLLKFKQKIRKIRNWYETFSELGHLWHESINLVYGSHCVNNMAEAIEDPIEADIQLILNFIDRKFSRDDVMIKLRNHLFDTNRVEVSVFWIIKKNFYRAALSKVLLVFDTSHIFRCRYVF